MSLGDIIGNATPWGAVVNGALKLIERVIPDPAAKAAAQMQILQMQQNGELAQLKSETDLALAQIAVDNTEAASPGVFRGGWRPGVGWTCGIALFVQLVFAPLATWGLALYGKTVVFPTVDMGTILALLGALLGTSIPRTVEKLKGLP